jgi:hypothetical protein
VLLTGAVNTATGVGMEGSCLRTVRARLPATYTDLVKVDQAKLGSTMLTMNISTIAEYAWYDWVKIRNTAAKFPVSNIQLGRVLGADIDIGPAMARKILKKNGSVMYRTLLSSLTPDEIQSPTEKNERE